MKFIRRFIVVLFISSSICYGQSKRDIFIQDSIFNTLYNISIDKDEYFKLKRNILKLEENNKSEPDLEYGLLDKSYQFNDIGFFKETLSFLVEKYGFHVSYMNESESYYNAIMTGDLSKWFKEMYLEKHVVWLKNNFEKQIDLRKLNELKMKDQLVNSYAAKVSQMSNLDSIQKKENIKLLSEHFFKNISDLYIITKKTDAYPTAKSFALVQNHFRIIETHNLQAEDNFDRYFGLFYDYYKKAYLNNDMSYMAFRNFDNYSYVHHGVQIFGLITIKDIPEYFRKSNEEIPVKDLKFANEIKKEFKWN